MPKCVYCGRKKRLFEDFNSYGFCYDCIAKIRLEISTQTTIVQKFLIDFESRFEHEQPKVLLREADAMRFDLETLELLRKKVPMFKSSLDYLYTGLAKIKKRLLIQSMKLSSVSHIESLIHFVERGAFDDFFKYERIQTIRLLMTTLLKRFMYEDFLCEKAKELETGIGRIRRQIDREHEKSKDAPLSGVNIVCPSLTNSVNVTKPFSRMPAIEFSNALGYSDSALSGDYVVIDMITTGDDCTIDKIIEVSAMRFESYRPADFFTVMVNPHQEIDYKICDFLGINQNIMQSYPSFSQVVESLDSFLGCYDLVGYKLNTTLDFLFVNGIHLFEKSRNFYDAYSISRQTMLPVVNYNLPTLCEHFGIKSPTMHRSASECFSVGKLFDHLVNR